jgi:hypothetical protein
MTLEAERLSSLPPARSRVKTLSILFSSLPLTITSMSIKKAQKADAPQEGALLSIVEYISTK